MFFSLFLLSNNFILLKINLFSDGHEHNLSIDTLQIEKENDDKNILTGTFLDNKKKHKVFDEFKIIKESK